VRNSRQIWEIGRIVSEGDLKFEIVGYIFADVVVLEHVKSL